MLSAMASAVLHFQLQGVDLQVVPQEQRVPAAVEIQVHHEAFPSVEAPSWQGVREFLQGREHCGQRDSIARLGLRAPECSLAQG